MTDNNCLKSDALPVRSLPYRVYVFTVIGLSVAGILISAYLAFSHYRIHTDIGFQSFCALSKAINCDTVSQSPYSVLGGLPVSVWGIAGYVFFLILVIFSQPASGERRRVWSLCMAIALVFSLGSVVFAGVSTFFIGSYCILCIATYGINLLLVYFTWIIRRRFRAEPFAIAVVNDLRFLSSNRETMAPVLITFGMGLIISAILFPAYWNVRMPAASENVRTGITAEGHPWIGAEQPTLEIVEFTDYLCFQCKKMHHYLRGLVARYPDRIRLVHRNYPMDQEFNPIVKEPFHEGAGKMAILAIHAMAVGKFWDMNDALFKQAGSGRAIDVNQIARETGLDAQTLANALQHEPYLQYLLLEIRQGMKLGIVGTPSYLIHGKLYEGNIPAEILEPFLKEGKS
jgi:uncharacterized membrane protein/predicted DsbA family dithiol-disulfide isomerase